MSTGYVACTALCKTMKRFLVNAAQVGKGKLIDMCWSSILGYDLIKVSLKAHVVESRSSKRRLLKSSKHSLRYWYSKSSSSLCSGLMFVLQMRILLGQHSPGIFKNKIKKHLYTKGCVVCSWDLQKHCILVVTSALQLARVINVCVWDCSILKRTLKTQGYLGSPMLERIFRFFGYMLSSLEHLTWKPCIATAASDTFLSNKPCNY